jgi:hypothetical protein
LRLRGAASGGAGHDAANCPRLGPGRDEALGLVPLDQVRDSGRMPGMLDILHGCRGRLGHMDCAAAEHRAACCERCEFNKCHPYRHKLTLFTLFGVQVRQPDVTGALP